MGILKSVLSGIADELGGDTSIGRPLAAAEAAMETAIAEHTAQRAIATTDSGDAPPPAPMPLQDMLERRAGAERRQFDIELPESFDDRRTGLDRRRPSAAFGKRAVRAE